MINYGNESDLVLLAQQMLVILGYSVVQDGKFKSNTLRAWHNFQRENKVPLTYNIDLELLRKRVEMYAETNKTSKRRRSSKNTNKDKQVKKHTRARKDTSS